MGNKFILAIKKSYITKTAITPNSPSPTGRRGREMRGLPPYSYLKASIGLSFEALRAG